MRPEHGLTLCSALKIVFRVNFMLRKKIISRIMLGFCSGLNENVPHWLGHLRTWSLVAAAI